MTDIGGWMAVEVALEVLLQVYLFFLKEIMEAQLLVVLVVLVVVEQQHLVLLQPQALEVQEVLVEVTL